MANTNAKAAPSANVKTETAAGPVKLDMKDPVINGHAAKLVQATEQEARVRDEAAISVTKAEGGTWGTMRDEVIATLKEIGPVNAGLVLDVYLLTCKQAGGTIASRATQYAANLRRMVKAATLGKDMPADLLTATRNEYLNHSFWTASGILSKTGTKKGQKTSATEAKAEKDAAKGEKAPSIGKLAEQAGQDKGLAELLEIVAQLHGPFKAEFYGRAKELASGILKKQAASGGSGQAAAAA